MNTTVNLTTGSDLGARLRHEAAAPAAFSAVGWKQQRPVVIGFVMIDNSTGVSARMRRHR